MSDTPTQDLGSGVLGAGPSTLDPSHLTDDATFCERLKELGNDWRYSNEFIGIVVRSRYPRVYE